MNIIIEQGKSTDIDCLENLYDQTNEILAKGINYPGWKKGVYPIREDALNGIKNKHLYIAKHQDKIAGSIILNHTPESGYNGVKWLTEVDYTDVYVIHTLVVHPDYTNKGIGKQLMDFAEALAVQNKIRSIRLDVYEHNLPAIRLYEGCGYQYITTADMGFGAYGLPWFKLYEKLIPCSHA